MFELSEATQARWLASTPPRRQGCADGQDPEGSLEASDDDGVGATVDELCDADLVDEIVELERSKANLEARIMMSVALLSDRADGWADPRAPGLAGRLGGRVTGPMAAAGELAPALHLSPITAAIRIDRACRVRDRLPLTLEALGRGDLDLGRVLAIEEATRPLDVDAALRVEKIVLPKAVDQTAGELRAALRRAVIVVDPDGAEDRRKVAVRGRRVRRYERDDGTSALEAVLSAIDSGEIYDLIDEVARRTKTTDDTRSMDARRADAFVWLVLGRDPHLGPQCDTPPPGSDGPPDDGSPDDGFPDNGALDDGDPDDGPSDDGPPGYGSYDPDEFDDDTGIPAGTQGSDPGNAPLQLTVSDASDDETDEAGWSQWPDTAETVQRVDALTWLDRARDERRSRLSELAALAISAMTCRQPRRRRWVALNTVLGPLGPVLVGELDGYGPITGHAARHLLASGAARAPDPPSGKEPTADQAARHDPPGWLDRDIRARDISCRYPGCRQPAHRADVDHTVAFPAGPTVPANLGVLCRRHHRLKHCGTWGLRHEPDDHAYTWTSTITGRTYTTHPRGTTGDWQGATTWPAGATSHQTQALTEVARRSSGVES